MSSVFDRLQDQLNIRKRERGISPLDIADLPPDLRKVMRMMLREVVIKYDDLVKKVEAMPKIRSLTKSQLDAALAELVKQNWLSRFGEGEFCSYKVNLRPKEGSRLGQDVWSALESRIGGESESQEAAGSE
ncbi:hypothetical protein ACFLZW_03145 [Chloroflexota bacterium]